MNFNPILIPAFLIAITIHEYAHGYIAFRFGDSTARDSGRLTFNPISHIDILGAIMIFLAGFGWAKPVPVNPYNLRNPRRDMMFISLAGPVSNIILAFILAKVFIFSANALAGIFGNSFHYVKELFELTIYINIILAWFNMIPIPPLDGSKILAGLLPERYHDSFERFERYGPFVFLGIILFSRITKIPIIWIFLEPMRNMTYRLIFG